MNTAITTRPRREGVRLGVKLVTLASAGALVLAACSGGSPEGGAGSSEPDGEVVVENFEMNFFSSPNSLDVARHFDANTMGIMSLFTEPLERLSGDGSLIPNLAEEVTQPDDLTIVYTIREGVQFSNGKELTAEDVAWTIDHVSDAEAGAATSSNLSAVASAEVTGEYEVTVSLHTPDPSARANLALVALVQDSEFAAENAAELGQPSAIPVGTGPYVAISSSAEAVELERNDNYWGDAPVPETITASFLDADDTAQRAMQSGSLNGTLVSNSVALPQYENIPGASIYSIPALQTYFIALDVTAEPFDDVHVRRAVAHAIDREGIMHAAFGEGASILPALIPAGTLTPLSSEAEVDEFFESLELMTFDLDAAAEELAQSQYPDGFEVELAVTSGTWMELAALNLQENLTPLGVTVNITSVTRQEWIDRIFSDNTTEMWPMSLGASVPDPRILAQLVTEPDGTFNLANWAPEDLQSLATDLTESADEELRFEAATTILTRISEEVPYIPLYQPEFTIVLADGFALTETPTVIDMASGLWMQNLVAE
ncbi:ABC transporter substrate-binding protein [Nesterenkonia ebinurensis]|uniref:ABC transporter substrate-binding protein n=1 Tax=Nesterenkonia ebinurensis TaxID=2608252 RepID=UPI00168BF3C2|nr:ABC transporter substrate-binding protein [Nesterenkonia ebinurensis]